MRLNKLLQTAAGIWLGASLPLLVMYGQQPETAPAPGTPSPEAAMKKKKGPPRPPRPGVSDPAVKRQMSTLTPTAVFQMSGGTPDWLVVTENAVWVSNGPLNSIHRMDPKTNMVAATVEVGKKPCAGLAEGFGSIWVPLCGDKALARVDKNTNAVTATLPIGPAESESGIATTEDSVWLVTLPDGKLSRISPKTNEIVAQIDVPPGSATVISGEGAIWVTSPKSNMLTRVDPKTNKVTDSIEVGPGPRFVTSGAGSVWTLNQGDGTVSRVDAKTRKVVATIQVGLPGSGGEMAFGLGRVWATVFQIPITAIDPATNQVTTQWFGDGGDSIRTGHGTIWLSNLRDHNVWRLNSKGF